MQKINLKLNGYDWHVYLRDEADQSVYNEIFKLKEYRSADDVIKNAKHPIIDVGAHAGFFSMYCRSLNKKVKIYAIEPEPDNLNLFKQHLAENKILGIKVVSGAIASQTEERQLILSADSHNHYLAGPSFRDEDRTEKTITVQTFSFADFCKQNKLKKISLLKMDIEGGEYELFNGMSADDFAMVNYVILEYHISREKSKEELEEKLRANGFGVQVFPSHFDKTMGFIWANNKRSKF
ncbi:MAG: FkbM family methyltransferase [Parcubacteria group bacterium Gr01-1014_13]|nr:MAG: FkbM family methyltransferase [Parcubacteria group bacterium Gr01-1014_13]